MAENNVVGLNELLQLFENDISFADVTAAKYLGKISAAIVKRRTELKMTQKEFAHYLDVSQGMVSRWEGGDYNFTVKGLAEIAEKLGLDLYINLKKCKENAEVYYAGNSEFTCVASEKTQFISNRGNIIDFAAWTSACSTNKGNIEKTYSIKEK